MYSPQYLFFLVIFSFAAYFVVTDESVARFVVLCTKYLRINIERLYWIIRFHPTITTNPIMRWYMMRKYMKQAKEMQKDFE
jgi:hypothetical protein